MILLTDLRSIPPLTRPVFATLGNFDGLHRGHKRILRKVICRAREEGGTSVVVTFEPHPLKVLHPLKAPALIQTREQKRDIMSHLGIQVLVEVPFDRGFAALSAAEFTRLLSESLKPLEIYIGEDFRFGNNREGEISFLQDASREYGFTATAFPKLKVEGEVVSSTRIRKLLLEGKMEEAVRLLGRPYTIEGEVRHGVSRGRTLGFPTANLAIENELVPAHGVYTTAVDLGANPLVPAVANLGTRTTFGEKAVAVEVHLLERGRDLYGERIRCLLFQFLRPETKFPSPEELKEAIGRDIASARAFFEVRTLNRRMFY